MPTVLRFHCMVKLKGCCLIFSLKYCSMLQKGNPFSYTDVRIYKGVRVMNQKKKKVPSGWRTAANVGFPFKLSKLGS